MLLLKTKKAKTPNTKLHKIKSNHSRFKIVFFIFTPPLVFANFRGYTPRHFSSVTVLISAKPVRITSAKIAVNSAINTISLNIRVPPFVFALYLYCKAVFYPTFIRVVIEL